jgi:hypothetical protein
MKKFILKLTVTIVITYLFLMGIQFVIDFYLKKNNSCNNNTMYKIYKGKITSDIIILGTSRAEAHYDTEVIQKITGLKTFNLGLSGTHYDILKIRWKSYLNHNTKPKVLILDLDVGALQNSKNIYGKFQYLPYYDTPEYVSIAKNIDNDYLFERIIPIYKYRSYEMDIYKQIKSQISNSSCSNNVNGYVEHNKNWIDKDYLNFKKLANEKASKFDVNNYSLGFSVLEEIIEYCKINNIKMIFIWSPSYFESQTYLYEHKKNINLILKGISKENNIDYFNFSKDTMCFDKKYFYNSSHLNKNGATLFSKKIGNLINQDIKK